MAKSTGRVLTVAEWAMELGCNPETLRVAIRRHELLATIDPLRRGRPYVISGADMRSFLDKRRTSR